MMSICHGSSYTPKDPILLPPPWLMYLAVLLNTFNIGMIPVELPPVPLIRDPWDLMLETEMPRPPEYLEMIAHFFKVDYIPSMLSLSMVTRKHEDI